MVDAAAHLASFRLTTKLIVEECLRRGWHVEAYYPSAARLRITRQDGQRLEVFGSSAPSITYITGISSNDKLVAHTLLQEQQLPVLATRLATSKEAVMEAVAEFLDEGKKIVMKPIDQGHGNGVTVAITNQQQATNAFLEARKYGNRILIQEQYDNATDLRLLIIDYAFRAALIRTPARVTGDGIHTVEQLIKDDNKLHRGDAYTKPLSLIDLEAAKKYLGERINEIPKQDEVMPVVGTANVGTGGETTDVTDLIPEWFRGMAITAAKAVQLPVCGVDFLVKKTPDPQDRPEDLNPKIIELNKSPALFIHQPPIHGKSRPVVEWYIDYLEKLKP